MKKFKITSSVTNGNSVRVDYVMANDSVNAVNTLMKLYPPKKGDKEYCITLIFKKCKLSNLIYNNNLLFLHFY